MPSPLGEGQVDELIIRLNQGEVRPAQNYLNRGEFKLTYALTIHK